MSRKMKKILALVLSVVMVMAFNITAFASTNAVNTNYDVTFKFIQRDVTVASPVNSTVYDDITVSVASGTNLKVALDAALAQEATAVGTGFVATWSGSGPYYLDALKLDGTNYINNYTIVGNTYTGTAWMWDYNDTIDANYPSSYLDQVSVTGDITIYLIFEKSSFSW